MMPSQPPEMVNILSHLRYGELDEDLTGHHSSNVLSQQAHDMSEAESTTHMERLFLTLRLGMVNQNAILVRQLEGLKDEVEELTSKNSSQLTTIMNCLERINTRNRPTPPPLPPVTTTQRHQQPQIGRPQPLPPQQTPLPVQLQR